MENYFIVFCSYIGGSHGKESACNAGDQGSIPGSERSLEKEMATHSSILACGILWTEEPGGLQSIGLQRVRHDSTTTTFKHISINACYIFTCEWILNLSGF